MAAWGNCPSLKDVRRRSWWSDVQLPRGATRAAVPPSGMWRHCSAPSIRSSPAAVAAAGPAPAPSTPPSACCRPMCRRRRCLLRRRLPRCRRHCRRCQHHRGYHRGRLPPLRSAAITPIAAAARIRCRPPSTALPPPLSPTSTPPSSRPRRLQGRQLNGFIVQTKWSVSCSDPCTGRVRRPYRTRRRDGQRMALHHSPSCDRGVGPAYMTTVLDVTLTGANRNAPTSRWRARGSTSTHQVGSFDL